MFSRNRCKSCGARVMAYFCRWKTASFWAFDHRLSPPTYARTDDSTPKLKLAKISKLRTIAANIQIIEYGERALNATSADHSWKFCDGFGCFTGSDQKLKVTEPITCRCTFGPAVWRCSA